MDMRLSITVNGVTYPVKYWYKVTRFLGQLWGLGGMMEVFQKGISVLSVEGEDPEQSDLDKVDEEKLGASILQFENLDILRDIAWAGIVVNTEEEVELEADDVMEVLLNDMSLLAEIYKAFIASMPQPKEGDKSAKSTGKRKAPAKTRGKKSA